MQQKIIYLLQKWCSGYSCADKMQKHKYTWAFDDTDTKHPQHAEETALQSMTCLNFAFLPFSSVPFRIAVTMDDKLLTHGIPCLLIITINSFIGKNWWI